MILFFLALTGCGLFLNASGNFEGMCEGSGYEFAFELDLDESSGDLEGDASFSVSGTTYRGDLEGERDGDEIEVDIEFEISGYTAPGTFEGKLDGDELSGDLTIVGSGVSPVLKCDLER